MFEAKADVGVGGEVKNEIGPGHRLHQRREVKVVAAHEFEIRMAPRGRQKFILAGGKIIPADDVFAASQQAVNEIAANKTGGTGDKNLFHVWARSLVRSDGTRQPF
jgi:hypothetical protein